MKKILLTPMAALVALSAYSADVAINENWTGTLLNGDNYIFGADNLTMTHTYTSARHLASTIFTLGNYKGAKLVVDSKVAGFPSNYFGFNGVVFNGNSGSDLTISSTENATKTWLGTLVADGGITINMNMGNSLFLQSGSNGNIKINNGSTINWNSANSTTGADGVTANTKSYLFTNADATSGSGNLVFGNGALTDVSGKGNVLYNFAVSSNLNVSFNSNLGDSVTMYNTAGVSQIGTFTIGSGKTLNLVSDGLLSVAAANFVGNDKSKSVFNLAGTSINASTIVVKNATINFNSGITSFKLDKGSTGSTIVLNANSTLTELAQDASLISGSNEVKVAKDVTLNLTNRFGMSGSNLTLEAGSTANFNGFTSGANTVGNNIMNFLTVANTATLNMAGGIRMLSANIDGKIRVNGYGSTVNTGSDTFIVGIRDTGLVTFNSNADFIQAYNNTTAKNWVKRATIVSNAGTGKVSFGNKVYFSQGTKITLNTTDALIIGAGESWAATSQGTSVFTLANGNSESVPTASSVLTVNAVNNIGSFSFDESGYVLELAFGDSGKLTVGESTGLTSFTGSYLTGESVVLKGEIYNQLRIYDLSEDDIVYYFKSADTGDIFVKAAGDGSYWVNTVAVPEPAEWAAIFGAIALGLALYRRSRK